MKDKDAAEYVLRVCTGIQDLTIIESNIQESLRNLFGKSVVLDFIARDTKGKIFNIEVQNTKDEAFFGAKRARYHQAMLDASHVPKGTHFDLLPEMYIIFLTPFNPFKKFGLNHVFYEAQTTIHGILWNNGVHEIYINAEATDGTLLSDMLQYFRKADPSDNRFGALSKTVKARKGGQKEVNTMCYEVEEYARECAEEAKIETRLEVIENMLAEGIDLAAALRLTELDEATYRKHTEERKDD